MRAVEGSLCHSPQRGVEIIGRLLLDARSRGRTSCLAERVLRGLNGNLQRDGKEAWLVSRARATRGRGLPSRGLMARLGVPVGGRVRQGAQWETNAGFPPGGETSERGRTISKLDRWSHWRNKRENK